MVKPSVPNADSKWLKNVSTTHGISYEDACNLYAKCSFDKDKLLESFNSSPSYNSKDFPKIVIFRDGILVGTYFYNSNTKDYQDLLEMLDKNEFDRDIFEAAFGKSLDVTELIVEQRGEYYKATFDMSDLKKNIEESTDVPKRVKREVTIKNPSVLPPTFIIGTGPTIKFMAVFREYESIIDADLNLKIGDIISYLWMNYGVSVHIVMGEELLDEHESVTVMKNTMVEFEEKTS